eukprot:m.38522 g.38522  ORF g.38522 m.38522 type:complete len:2635 (-) comp10205_c0_seq4:573-8477(-)
MMSHGAWTQHCTWLVLWLVLVSCVHMPRECSAADVPCVTEVLNGQAWAGVSAGRTVVQGCPPGSVGEAQRVCCSPQVPGCSGPGWLYPDYSTCRVLDLFVLQTSVGTVASNRVVATLTTLTTQYAAQFGLDDVEAMALIMTDARLVKGEVSASVSALTSMLYNSVSIVGNSQLQLAPATLFYSRGVISLPAMWRLFADRVHKSLKAANAFAMQSVYTSSNTTVAILFVAGDTTRTATHQVKDPYGILSSFSLTVTRSGSGSGTKRSVGALAFTQATLFPEDPDHFPASTILGITTEASTGQSMMSSTSLLASQRLFTAALSLDVAAPGRTYSMFRSLYTNGYLANNETIASAVLTFPTDQQQLDDQLFTLVLSMDPRPIYSSSTSSSTPSPAQQQGQDGAQHSSRLVKLTVQPVCFFLAVNTSGEGYTTSSWQEDGSVCTRSDVGSTTATINCTCDALQASFVGVFMRVVQSPTPTTQPSINQPITALKVCAIIGLVIVLVTFLVLAFAPFQRFQQSLKSAGLVELLAIAILLAAVLVQQYTAEATSSRTCRASASLGVLAPTLVLATALCIALLVTKRSGFHEGRLYYFHLYGNDWQWIYLPVAWVAVACFGLIMFFSMKKDYPTETRCVVERKSSSYYVFLVLFMLSALSLFGVEIVALCTKNTSQTTHFQRRWALLFGIDLFLVLSFLLYQFLSSETPMLIWGWMLALLCIINAMAHGWAQLYSNSYNRKWIQSLFGGEPVPRELPSNIASAQALRMINMHTLNPRNPEQLAYRIADQQAHSQHPFSNPLNETHDTLDMDLFAATEPTVGQETVNPLFDGGLQVVPTREMSTTHVNGTADHDSLSAPIPVRPPKQHKGHKHVLGGSLSGRCSLVSSGSELGLDGDGIDDDHTYCRRSQFLAPRASLLLSPTVPTARRRSRRGRAGRTVTSSSGKRKTFLASTRTNATVWQSISSTSNTGGSSAGYSQQDDELSHATAVQSHTSRASAARSSSIAGGIALSQPPPFPGLDRHDQQRRRADTAPSSESRYLKRVSDALHMASVKAKHRFGITKHKSLRLHRLADGQYAAEPLIHRVRAGSSSIHHTHTRTSNGHRSGVEVSCSPDPIDARPPRPDTALITVQSSTQMRRLKGRPSLFSMHSKRFSASLEMLSGSVSEHDDSSEERARSNASGQLIVSDKQQNGSSKATAVSTSPLRTSTGASTAAEGFPPVLGSATGTVQTPKHALRRCKSEPIILQTTYDRQLLEYLSAASASDHDDDGDAHSRRSTRPRLPKGTRYTTQRSAVSSSASMSSTGSMGDEEDNDTPSALSSSCSATSSEDGSGVEEATSVAKRIRSRETAGKTGLSRRSMSMSVASSIMSSLVPDQSAMAKLNPHSHSYGVDTLLPQTELQQYKPPRLLIDVDGDEEEAKYGDHHGPMPRPLPASATKYTTESSGTAVGEKGGPLSPGQLSVLRSQKSLELIGRSYSVGVQYLRGASNAGGATDATQALRASSTSPASTRDTVAAQQTSAIASIHGGTHRSIHGSTHDSLDDMSMSASAAVALSREDQMPTPSFTQSDALRAIDNVLVGYDTQSSATPSIAPFPTDTQLEHTPDAALRTLQTSVSGSTLALNVSPDDQQHRFRSPSRVRLPNGDAALSVSTLRKATSSSSLRQVAELASDTDPKRNQNTMDALGTHDKLGKFDEKDTSDDMAAATLRSRGITPVDRAAKRYSVMSGVSTNALPDLTGERNSLSTDSAHSSSDHPVEADKPSAAVSRTSTLSPLYMRMASVVGHASGGNGQGDSHLEHLSLSQRLALSMSTSHNVEHVTRLIATPVHVAEQADVGEYEPEGKPPAIPARSRSQSASPSHHVNQHGGKSAGSPNASKASRQPTLDSVEEDSTRRHPDSTATDRASKSLSKGSMVRQDSLHSHVAGVYETPAVLRGMDDIQAKRATAALRKKRDEKSRHAFLRMQPKELDRDDIQLTRVLGKGAFGVVHQATLRYKNGDSLECAIKTLKTEQEKEREGFLEELELLKHLRHPNIVGLIGFITLSDPIFIVLEYMKGGSLYKILKTRVSPRAQLLNWAVDIVSGLEYLHGLKIIHRDLATRNVLVDGCAKICDFGFSHALEDNAEYVQEKLSKIPVRWVSPEALNYSKYSKASDMWSFAILLHEMFSGARLPYKGWGNLVVATHVGLGHRLPPLPGCPRVMYELMIACWHPSPRDRPTAAKVRKALHMVLSTPELLSDLHNNHTDPLQNVYRTTKINGVPLAMAWMEKGEKNASSTDRASLFLDDGFDNGWITGAETASKSKPSGNGSIHQHQDAHRHDHTQDVEDDLEDPSDVVRRMTLALHERSQTRRRLQTEVLPRRLKDYHRQQTQGQPGDTQQNRLQQHQPHQRSGESGRQYLGGEGEYIEPSSDQREDQFSMPRSPRALRQAHTTKETKPKRYLGLFTLGRKKAPMFDFQRPQSSASAQPSPARNISADSLGGESTRQRKARVSAAQGGTKTSDKHHLHHHHHHHHHHHQQHHQQRRRQDLHAMQQWRALPATPETPPPGPLTSSHGKEQPRVEIKRTPTAPPAPSRSIPRPVTQTRSTDKLSSSTLVRSRVSATGGVTSSTTTTAVEGDRQLLAHDDFHRQLLLDHQAAQQRKARQQQAA